MKTCSRCKIEKDLNKFFNDKHTSDGKCPYCKECVYSRRKTPIPKTVVPQGMKKCKTCNEVKQLNEYWADKDNKSDGRYSMCISCKTKATYKWRAANLEYYNKSMRDYRANMSFSERRDIDLKSWFGLPPGWYEDTLKKQDYKCAICRKPNPSTKRCLAVDHCHASGKVRGILCYGCNRLMALLDNPELLEKAIAYKNRA